MYTNISYLYQAKINVKNKTENIIWNYDCFKPDPYISYINSIIDIYV